jgi:hypothetical protein
LRGRIVTKAFPNEANKRGKIVEKACVMQNLINLTGNGSMPFVDN